MERPKERSVYERVQEMVVATWGEKEIKATEELIRRESNWNPQAINRKSGACGLWQALPCHKLGSLEIENQINWGRDYIRERYKTPTKALEFHRRNGWY